MDPQFRVPSGPGKTWVGWLALVGGLVCLLVGGLVWWLLHQPSGNPVTDWQGTQDLTESFATGSVSKDATVTASESEAPDKIYVDLKGAVQHPGVYALPAGSRVFDLIDAAGGLTEEAADRALNQAQLLSDQAVIDVPTQAEWEARSESLAANPGPANPSTRTGTTPAPSSGKVNINQADLTQLQTLPGIGAKKAQAILDYRASHGSFQSVEDLTQVKGIGPKLLEQLREVVTVE